jgi:hypothetical protein
MRGKYLDLPHPHPLPLRIVGPETYCLHRWGESALMPPDRCTYHTSTVQQVPFESWAAFTESHLSSCGHVVLAGPDCSTPGCLWTRNWLLPSGQGARSQPVQEGGPMHHPLAAHTMALSLLWRARKHSKRCPALPRAPSQDVQAKIGRNTMQMVPTVLLPENPRHDELSIIVWDKDDVFDGPTCSPPAVEDALATYGAQWAACRILLGNTLPNVVKPSPGDIAKCALVRWLLGLIASSDSVAVFEVSVFFSHRAGCT